MESPATRWRASLAIGGMTCGSCANAITEALEHKQWKAKINLISNGASVEYCGTKEDARQVAEAIEELGYEANIDHVVSLDEPSVNAAVETDPSRLSPAERHVDIKIDGFYCDFCAERSMKTLSRLDPQLSLRILQLPTEHEPLIKLAYVPNAPTFTIRHILETIEQEDPKFKASIFHPPSLEERAKVMQIQHQRRLLYRVVLTTVAAIPTFVIGVVYMSLVSPASTARKYLMSPLVAGISHAQISLLILASLVWVLAADVFHNRALKEIWALWKPGSKTPILQRFFRFGSMNLLMSLGTTIAYVSSVSRLIAAGVARPEPRHIADSDFYFDSVVFLTLFVLVGRVIESHSKRKTGDAVESLGKLRPTTALLVQSPMGECLKSEDDTTTLVDSTPALSDNEVPVDLLDYGDLVRVPHGSSPPCDGTLESGATEFDESSLTGESRPIRKQVGDTVFAGTVNKAAPVAIRVTGTAGKSMLDQIVRAVREGQATRAPLERVADCLTAYFVPGIILVAVVTFFVWFALGMSGVLPVDYLPESSSGGNWATFALQFAIAVFVVACPCGLALAAPTAIFVGGGLAARYGILAKGGGEAFETASKVDTVVFDKTGTLTVGGEPTVTDSEVFEHGQGDDPESTTASRGETDRDLLFASLRSVEQNSSHPIAKAIVSFCSRQPIARAPKVEVCVDREIPGKGLKAGVADGDTGLSFDLLVGNETLMTELGVRIPRDVQQTLQRWKYEAKSIALVATSKPACRVGAPPSASGEATSLEVPAYEVTLALAISDPVRPEASTVVRALKARGTQVWMLSGDNVITARAVAAQVDIAPENVIAGVLPAQKADKVKELQFKRHCEEDLSAAEEGQAGFTARGIGSGGKRATVAMVGDGINDAPALTTADVGIAIGDGSDVAIASAGFVVLMSGGGSSSHDERSPAASGLAAIPTLLDLSSAVFRRIKLNFTWALVYNLVAVPVAAGCLYPLVGGNGEHVRLDPVWASLAMALSSISVLLSSLALGSGWPVIGFRPR